MAISKTRWILAGGLVAIFWFSQLSPRLHPHQPGARTSVQEENRAIRIGSAAVIAQDAGLWTCSPTQESLDEVIGWVVRHNQHEIVRTMIKTRSIGLGSGMRVKILDTSFTQTKVRVTEPGDPRDDRECWVVGEAAVTK
jgi:hypothetical protein